MKININKKITIVLIIIIIVIINFIYKDDFNILFAQNNVLEESIEENNNTNKESKNRNIENEENNIVIHISGAIVNEGVIKLKEGSRIIDAIELSGGLKENAYINDINLAEKLEDGIKVHIPTIDEYNQEKEKTNEAQSNNQIKNESNNKSQKKNTKININTATQSELENLPGIGSSTAIKIINYRKENGKFKSIEEIKNVSRNR